MTVTFLPSIGADKIVNGSIPSMVGFLGGVFVIVKDVDQAIGVLQATAARLATYLDVTALISTEDIVSLIDAGANTVIVNKVQLGQLVVSNVELDRVALATLGMSKADIVEAAGDKSVGMFAANVTDVTHVEEWLSEYGTEHPPVYVSLEEPTEEHAVKIAKLGGIPIIPAEYLSTDSGKMTIDAAKVLLAAAQSDRPDGLFTTLVTDERGAALGLVYSSENSVAESLKTGRGVYQSRKRGLWYKGESSGDVQELVRLAIDCDQDCLQFVVRQKGKGFCHLGTATCFGKYSGLSKLQKTLQERKSSAPEGSYTARLFNDPNLLRAKIMEEASELCEATSPNDVAFEAADLIYFALTKCISAGVSLEDVERNLDLKSLKIKRRPGNAKEQWVAATSINKTIDGIPDSKASIQPTTETVTSEPATSDKIRLQQFDAAKEDPQIIQEALKRPSQRSTEKIMGIVAPIIKEVREGGDAALLKYTHQFEKATSLTSPVLRAPFAPELMQLSADTTAAIDLSYENIRKFHAAQREEKPLSVETMPGIVCQRFSRPIERVGLYVPGGTAVLPSTALMLGVPAMVAGCDKIVIASPPRADGSLSPEIVYIAHKIGAEMIVLAGGAQAVAAMAYGTESVIKVDKILGPGNQFVTAAKMMVTNDNNAAVGIDMPAGPSEVLVIADKTSVPAFVASDLLSQAEHGIDSQVVLIAIDLTPEQLLAIEDEVDSQAKALPRVDIVQKAIDHSVTLTVKTPEQALDLSNEYAPEHLILQLADAEKYVALVKNAGSVFIGPWTPESVGDYSAGVNHSLPTYGYARQYSGVNLGSYLKHITASNLTPQGLQNVGPAVMQLAKVEELEAHRRAVSIRLNWMAANLKP